MESGLNPWTDSPTPSDVYRRGMADVCRSDSSNLRGMGDILPPWLRGTVRQAVSLITLAQTLAAFSRLSTHQRVLAIVLEVVLAACWGMIAHRRRGDWLNISILIALIGLGGWLQVITGNGQVFVVSYAVLFIAPVWYPVTIFCRASGSLAMPWITVLICKRGGGAYFSNPPAGLWIGD